MGYVKRPLLIWIAYLLGILIAASALINVWAIATIPINKQTVYVGALTFWTAVSLILWVIFSTVSCITSLWVHFKHPAFKRQAWLSLIASELFYISIFMIVGSIVEYVLDGNISYDWTMILMIASVIGFFAALKNGKSRTSPR